MAQRPDMTEDPQNETEMSLQPRGPRFLSLENVVIYLTEKALNQTTCSYIHVFATTRSASCKESLSQ